MRFVLEGMPLRARPSQKELEEQFVGVCVAQSRVVPEMSVAILRTDLAELAGPIGEIPEKPVSVRLALVAWPERSKRQPESSGG